MNARLQALADAGVSIWLDDLSRERIETGNLEELIRTRGVIGVTTNPTIFAKALADGERYTEQLAELKAAGADVDSAIFELTTTDVRHACDILYPQYERTGGVDGRVSIEVDPGLAHDSEATIRTARRLADAVNRPNLFVKIPATEEGLPAIAASIAAGLNINVTLIFSLERYRGVMDAYLYGLEQALAEGHDLSAIHSVASFFVSRVDTEVDSRLPEDSPLRGRAGLANARLAYEAYEQVFAGERFARLAEQGARRQRPLWASTGVKNPDYRDTMYITDLVVADVVNTMPEATLEAFADHGEVIGDTVHGTYDESRDILNQLESQNIAYDDVVERLEREGVDKFAASWKELQDTVRDELKKA